MTIRLLAVDLDGTLLDSHWKPSQGNLNALRETSKRGVQIVFVTGRRYRTTTPITSAFDFPHYTISTGGAMTRSSSGDVLSARVMDRSLVRRFLRHAASVRPWTFVLSDAEGRESYLCEAPALGNHHVARHAALNAECLVHVPDLVQAVGTSVIGILLVGYLEDMRTAAAVVEGFASRDRLKLLRTEYVTRDLCMLDVVDGSTDKGVAVRELANTLGIDRHDVMAIGDNLNDLEMLAFAGCAVVMGNARPELKSRGWHVTSGNDDDGVARAIETFILHAPPQTRAL